MPRKAKEKNDNLNITANTAKKVKTTKKKSTSKPKSSSVSTTTKEVAKSTSSIKSTKKSSNTKKTSTKSIITEYYDLPFRYNQTIVKILAQTPNVLFIYWDISDDDRAMYLKEYGENFFEYTRPYLVITNKTMNYTFEVEINDFANSWYLHINDANCEYKVELVRKFIVNFESSSITSTPDESIPLNHFSDSVTYHINDYVPITSSNEIETPNNHILFDKLGNSVFFRNVKTNIVERKNISSLSFLQNMGKAYNIYDLYKKIYSNDIIDNEFGINIPSSSSSSTFK